MANPLKTEHAIDWSHTAQEIEDHYQSGMIERDRLAVTTAATITAKSLALSTHRKEPHEPRA